MVASGPLTLAVVSLVISYVRPLKLNVSPVSAANAETAPTGRNVSAMLNASSRLISRVFI